MAINLEILPIEELDPTDMLLAYSQEKQVKIVENPFKDYVQAYRLPNSFFNVVGIYVPDVTYEEVESVYNANLSGKLILPPYSTTFRITDAYISENAFILRYLFIDLSIGDLIKYTVQLTATPSSVTSNVTWVNYDKP